MDERDKAFWAKCLVPACGHIWAAAYYPMDASKFARIAMKATCPKCGATKDKVGIAKQDSGRLLEEVSA